MSEGVGSGRWLVGAVGLAAFGALCSACLGARSPSEERSLRAARGKGDVVIAAVWPWELRKELRYGDGLDMAVDELNGAGGVLGRKVRLVRYDDKESVDEGRVVAERIVADPEIVAVIGHLQSYVTVPAAAVYDLSGLVLLAPTATDPELTARGYRHVFRASFSQAAIGRQLAQIAAERGHKRVAIEYIRNNYGRGLANAFEESAGGLGLTIAARQSYDPSEQASERTFEPTLREWKGVELDAVFLAGEVPSAAYFVASARAAGIGAPIIGGDAMGTPALMQVAGASADGMVVAAFFHPDEPRPEVQRFVELFRKRHGVVPDAGAAVGYDSVRLLAQAMQRAQSTVPSEVAKALRDTRDWPGVTGRFAFDEHGDMVGRRLVKTVVRNGRFEYLPDGPQVSTGP